MERVGSTVDGLGVPGYFIFSLAIDTLRRVFMAFLALAPLYLYDVRRLKGLPEWLVMSSPFGSLVLSRANHGEPRLWDGESLGFAGTSRILQGVVARSL
jgi:hypothetical protein